MASNQHALRVYDSILGLLSNEDNPTPLVRLHRVVPEGAAEVLGKFEVFNPGGSVKDRAALRIIEDGEERGALKPGGTMVYATCSITPQENVEQVKAFLARTADAQLLDSDPDQPGRQILPGEEDMDGFYYAVLTKTHA